jgi:SM-20-related protein
VSTILRNAHNLIAHALLAQGWCVTPDYITRSQVDELRAHARSVWDGGKFKSAGVGHQGSYTTHPAIRGDSIAWLDTLSEADCVKALLADLESLRLVINQTCMLGLFDLEAHFARYDEGAHYARHLDRFRDDSSRVVSCVLYLNEPWEESNGGQLRLFLDENSDDARDVLPQGGVLVTFLSDRFAHEVLPARRERWSIAGWFRMRS